MNDILDRGRHHRSFIRKVNAFLCLFHYAGIGREEDEHRSTFLSIDGPNPCITLTNRNHCTFMISRRRWRQFLPLFRRLRQAAQAGESGHIFLF
jgi:hypothetical protein